MSDGWKRWKPVAIGGMILIIFVITIVIVVSVILYPSAGFYLYITSPAGTKYFLTTDRSTLYLSVNQPDFKFTTDSQQNLIAYDTYNFYAVPGAGLNVISTSPAGNQGPIKLTSLLAGPGATYKLSLNGTATCTSVGLNPIQENNQVYMAQSLSPSVINANFTQPVSCVAGLTPPPVSGVFMNYNFTSSTS